MNSRGVANPKTCRAAVFRGVGQPMELEDFSIPQVVGSEALVRVECCTICGSDLHTLTGRRQEPTPSILGHEAVGVVEQLGDQPPNDLRGESIDIGDRITWSVAAACGQCDRCSRGFPQKCRKLAKYGHETAQGRYSLSGGLAEFIVLRPGSAIVKIGASLPKEVICPANCATATIAAALRVVGEIAGQRVLIFGAGMLGLTAAAMSSTRRAASVTVVDRLTERLVRSESFGTTSTVQWNPNQSTLTSTILETSGADAFDLILELSGASEACAAAVNLGDIGAHIVFVGSVTPAEAVSIDPERVVRRWLSIHGVHNYAPIDLVTAVDFLCSSQDKFPFGELVAREFTLKDVNQAFHFSLDEKPVRVAVCP